MADDVMLELKQGVAIITLNRPDAHNTLSPGMIEGLGAAYQRCDADDAVGAVVVTGAGSSFCAGADMSGGAQTFDAEAVEFVVDSCPLAMQAFEVRKPVIAACNGHAVGVGLGIAMQADIRVFADEGKYGFLQARRGVVTDFAMEYLLPRIIGLEKALELLLRGQRLSGGEAVDWGLAGRSVPAAQVLNTALDIAGDMVANAAPLAMAMHKRLLWQGLDMGYRDLAAKESRCLNHSMSQADAIEGGTAWAERRAPRWSGSVAGDWPVWMDDEGCD
ncbi:enoyl-CoA hydratase/isomerase family protein [Seongchinamella sediminis]|nr:enoyl-CoA hydratase-related protein [Seongchinamella sediminis]